MGGEDEGDESIEKVALISLADLRVYCIGPKLPRPLAVAGGEGGGEGLEDAVRARLEV